MGENVTILPASLEDFKAAIDDTEHKRRIKWGEIYDKLDKDGFALLEELPGRFVTSAYQYYARRNRRLHYRAEAPGRIWVWTEVIKPPIPESEVVDFGQQSVVKDYPAPE